MTSIAIDNYGKLFAFRAVDSTASRVIGKIKFKLMVAVRALCFFFHLARLTRIDWKLQAVILALIFAADCSPDLEWKLLDSAPVEYWIAYETNFSNWNVYTVENYWRTNFTFAVEYLRRNFDAVFSERSFSSMTAAFDFITTNAIPSEIIDIKICAKVQ